ncbi:hypothetical protein [Roseovarius indicus]|uniref:hypothetical protein n=1 Tax=Roseovarius indicus TaxID=540747 RepID=UPI00351787A1
MTEKGFSVAGKVELFRMLIGLEQFLSDKKVPPEDQPTVARSAQISGNVVIGKGAKILENAVVKGPCVVSEGAIVGSYTLVRGPSYIGKHAIVGNHCYITNSFLADYARVTHFCGVSRSIIFRNACLSTFVNTPTLRADRAPILIEENGEKLEFKKIGAVFERDSYVAPHVMIMPGVRIGEGSFIGSFQVVEKDVSPGILLKPDIPVVEKPFDRTFPEVPPGGDISAQTDSEVGK